jgi:hypothetical protein
MPCFCKSRSCSDCLALALLTVSLAGWWRESLSAGERTTGAQVAAKLRPHREPVLASALEAKVNEKMDAPIAVNFSSTPLQEAIDFIDTLQDLRFQYDAAVVGKDGTLANDAVTVAAKDIPLRILLKLLLEPSALDWVIRDERIVITAREIATRELSGWQYDVSDLAAAGIPIADLAATIIAVVAQQEWQPAGGRGTLEFADGAITVRQSRQVHRQVCRLLGDIRQHLTETEAETAKRGRQFRTKRYRIEDFSPGTDARQLTDAISEYVCQSEWTRFGGRGTIEPAGNSLEVATEQWVHERLGRLLEMVGSFGLQRGSNGSIIHFHQALDIAQGIDLERDAEPLPTKLNHQTTVDFQEVPPLDALTYFSRSYGVSFRLSDEVQQAVNGGKAVTLLLEKVQLRSALDAVLEPSKLDWYYGDDTVIAVDSPARCATRCGVRVYRIKELVGSDMGAADLVRIITGTIEPDSWKSPRPFGSVRILPDVLVISHNRQTLDRVAEFLDGVGKLTGRR